LITLKNSFQNENLN